MAEVEIKVNIPRNGTIPGTCKWLADELQGASLVLTETQAGKSAIAVKLSTGHTKVLAVFGYFGEYDNWVTSYREMDYIEPLLFGTTLTDAAHERVKQLGDLAKSVMEDYMEGQDADAPHLAISAS